MRQNKPGKARAEEGPTTPTIKVRGKSQLGIDQVREHGDQWEVLTAWEHVLWLGNRPGTLLRATKDGFRRWVETPTDPDLENA